MHQVTTVQQAVEAAEQGVDIIIAQGGESGGYGGVVSTMPLVPQVVDAVRPLPVIAAGGITDGRGLAAALMLGAQGVNVGTRFLATKESPIVDSWKQAIIDARAQDAVKADVWNDIAPDMGTKGYGTVVRALRTPFLDEWSAKREEAVREMPRIREEIAKAGAEGRFHDLMMFGGQSAGAITDLPSAADVVAAIASEAEEVLRGRGGSWCRGPLIVSEGAALSHGAELVDSRGSSLALRMTVQAPGATLRQADARFLAALGRQLSAALTHLAEAVSGRLRWRSE